MATDADLVVPMRWKAFAAPTLPLISAPPARAARPGPRDLHADVPELLDSLAAAVEYGDHLDAYLYACGIGQIVEDRLAGTDAVSRRLAGYLGSRGGGLPVGALRRGLDARAAVASLGPARRALRDWNGHVARLGARLADVVSGAEPAGLDEPLGRVRGGFPGSELLEGALLRQPSCFRSFDQRPRDIKELAARFAGRYPDRAAPVLVLGVRTSGGYLAPLAGSALRALGFTDVRVRTTRPGERLLSGETGLVRGLAAAGALVMLLDDPPASGASLAAAAAAVEAAGFARDRIVLTYAAFDAGGSAGPIERWPQVVLEGGSWHVRRQLGRSSLVRALSALFPGEIVDVEAVDVEAVDVTVDAVGMPSRAGHLAVPLTARIGSRQLPMVAESTGLGYLGRHAADVAHALSGQVPHVYGVVDAILLRERLRGEDADREARSGRAVPAEPIAQYVAARRQILPLADDRSALLGGRQPVWEIAARVLAKGFGRLGTPLRPMLIDPLLRTLSTAETPCLVDGNTHPDLWREDGRGGWSKTDYDDGCFSHLDLATYDAVYDLPGAVLDRPELEEALVARYQDATGEKISAARWCVYKLVHAWNARRRTAADPRQASEQAVRQFLSGVYVRDVDTEADGPWCALDVDGVLENDAFGFSASSPAGLMALRALRVHGYRVLLATGRSLADVRERCAAYRLAGGAAEYGAVVYDAAGDETTPLVPEHDGELAATLTRLPGVAADPGFRHCVRAFRRSAGGGGTRGLDASRIPQGGRYSVVRGDAQTDFVPRGVNKIDAVRALMRLLDDDAGPGAAPDLAVGDTAPDVAMLKAARLGFAPGNADRGLMRIAGVPVLRASYQAGLAAAVGRLIGHAPGGCPMCRAPEPSAEDRALLALLAIPEAGRSGAPARLARLARLALAGAPAGSGGRHTITRGLT